MVLYFSLTALLALIGVLCLRKRFSYGIIPIVIVSSIISCVVCSVYDSVWCLTSEPDYTDVDTVVVKSKNMELPDNGRKLYGTSYSVNDIDTVVISKGKPHFEIIKTRMKKDVGMPFDVTVNETVYRVLFLNKKDYAIFNAYKDSLEEGEGSLE